MRKLLFFFCFSCSVLSLFATPKDESQNNIKRKKIYLNQDDIFIDQSNIYARINNEWKPVKSIKMDDRGIYTNELWPFIPFTCVECGTWNNSWAKKCKKCGLPRPD